MINKIDKNQLQGIFKGSSKPSGNFPIADENKTDASLQISYESLIDKLNQEPLEEANKVERARQLLLSGELDSPENIRKAAENIIQFGV